MKRYLFPLIVFACLIFSFTPQVTAAESPGAIKTVAAKKILKKRKDKERKKKQKKEQGKKSDQQNYQSPPPASEPVAPALVQAPPAAPSEPLNPTPTPAWAPPAYPTAMPTAEPTGSPTPHDSPTFDPFSPFTISLPSLVTDSYSLDSRFTCKLSDLSAGVYSCVNTQFMDISFSCTTDPASGTQACMAIITDSTWVDAYFRQDMMYVRGQAYGLLMQACREDGKTRCDIAYRNLGFSLNDERWGASCTGTIGSVNWDFNCSGDIAGGVTGIGTIEAHAVLPLTVVGGMYIQGRVNYQSTTVGRISIDKVFNDPCLPTGGISVVCPAKEGKGCLSWGAGASCGDSSGWGGWFWIGSSY